MGQEAVGQEVTAVFQTSWEKVFHSVEWAVEWGLAHRDISNVQSIGVDEVLWHRGHKYQTVVYQIDAECKRPLRVGQDRTVRTLLRFFRGSARTARHNCASSAATCGNRTLSALAQDKSDENPRKFPHTFLVW